MTAQDDAELLALMERLNRLLGAMTLLAKVSGLTTLALDALKLLERRRGEALALQKLALFGLACLGMSKGDDDYLCNELDARDVQDIAEKTGVLVPVKVTEPCGEHCACAEWDDFPLDCYRMPDDVKAATAAMREQQG